MQSEVKTITLPSGKKIELVPYLSAGFVLDMNEKKAEEMNRFIYESLVVSVDGSKDNIYETIRSLTIEDFRALDQETSEFVTKQLTDKKKEI